MNSKQILLLSLNKLLREWIKMQVENPTDKQLERNVARLRWLIMSVEGDV